MRTGKRKLSKNSAMASNMAYFFAKRCSAAFQRQALSEMLGMTSISPGMPTEVLASTLEKWLKGENTIADIVLSEVQTLPQTESEPFVASTAPLDSSDGKTMFFFGVEGDIYNYPLQETAKFNLGRMMRQNKVSNDDLVEYVLDMRKNSQLCIIDEDTNSNKEPKIICSMGLRWSESHS